MLRIFHFTVSIIMLTILSLLINNNLNKIRPKFIIQLLIIEIILAYLFLHSQIGLYFTKYIIFFFDQILIFTTIGTNFIFGNMNKEGIAYFFLNVLCPIILISAIIGVLKYVRVLSFIVITFGSILAKISGMGKLESFNVISSLILGQSENFILYKDVLKKISENRIYTMAVTAMSTASLSVIGAYTKMLDTKYVIAALILNMFSTFIILSISNPYQINDVKDIKINIFQNKKQSFFEILGEYILIGFNIVMIISAMLIAFIALISAIDTMFKSFLGITFQEILGYLFLPIVWIIGIPTNEALQVSKIMAIKLLTNEFIAMTELQKISQNLSTNTIGIVSIFLTSFANFSSIGIIIGTIKFLNKEKGNILSQYSLKLIYNSTLINLLSTTVAALII
ncbi:NupC/NupG family nucleoside CNT transporter [Blochmannia endosymbiont of Colobopsis nipponica]|uniref:nucleoside transporter C-terminal domain-containing protein n=1 Tax=Blochmannia endosymbiont of Colobopsis nipponica TaxID=2681987 RepID=UPI00177C433D|nr:nucleoside transporter C-terminal domain-containing protein [Blochmannia endosymbiont of Colobopsis nipponica]QOI10964.1 NupC/NupG family nucleoside CNT transporter [Blochmannia endosymbiont of Colobopsis nipponica]